MNPEPRLEAAAGLPAARAGAAGRRRNAAHRRRGLRPQQRAVIMADGKLVTAADLDLDGKDEDSADVINLKAVREMADRKAIRRAIARTQGNISGAAKMLGISRPTLYDLLKQYEMRSEEHTSELQSLMRISYDVFCLKKKKT